MKTRYFFKNQDGLKFLKPAERAELDAAERAFLESEEGQTCRPLRMIDVGHAHEMWQIRSDGRGGFYCAACGLTL